MLLLVDNLRFDPFVGPNSLRINKIALVILQFRFGSIEKLPLFSRFPRLSKFHHFPFKERTTHWSIDCSQALFFSNLTRFPRENSWIEPYHLSRITYYYERFEFVSSARVISSVIESLNTREERKEKVFARLATAGKRIRPRMGKRTDKKLTNSGSPWPAFERILPTW